MCRCLTLLSFQEMVATGQIGRDPAIHIWSATSMETLSILTGEHSRGVCAVDFSGMWMEEGNIPKDSASAKGEEAPVIYIRVDGYNGRGGPCYYGCGWIQRKRRPLLLIWLWVNTMGEEAPVINIVGRVGQ